VAQNNGGPSGGNARASTENITNGCGYTQYQCNADKQPKQAVTETTEPVTGKGSRETNPGTATRMFAAEPAAPKREFGRCATPTTRGFFAHPYDKPTLIVEPRDLPDTARGLCELFATSDYLFERAGKPVKVVRPADGGSPAAVTLTRYDIVIEAHRLCQPVMGSRRSPVTLPLAVARMYLDMSGEWGLPPLDGITTAPLLAPDGNIRSVAGYDQTTRLWCCDVPGLQVLENPCRCDAETSLQLLRRASRTFPFADAVRRIDQRLGVEVVDLDSPPGRDESAFLMALLMAICRPSLRLAPGYLVVGPAISGAGIGKGMLVRLISTIAFGIRPRAFTAGHDRQELDKRIAAELVEAAPAVFLDNLNNVLLRSDTLASVLTERPARVRLLGRTRMVELNSAAFVAVTGNGLTLCEDLVRRFICTALDARCEDPEARPFPAGFLAQIAARRHELLAAALTIWRWGRRNAPLLVRGRPLGSFETCCEWARDPLLTLGCSDPVERIDALKTNDPQRRLIAELFGSWWAHHRGDPVKAADIAEPVRKLIDPQGRGRQLIASYLAQLSGTRAAGFVFYRREAADRWDPATYLLK
jgi:putative DNA primase/helicase